MKRMSASVALVPTKQGRRTPTVRTNVVPTRDEQRNRHEEALAAAIDLSLSVAGEEIDELFPLKSR
jgi:hypothetical protein